MAEEEREEVDQDSYYAILNIPKDASEDEIKRSYRHLAQICHPDKTPESVSTSGATSNFMRIQEAYEVNTSQRAIPPELQNRNFRLHNKFSKLKCFIMGCCLQSASC